MSLEARPVRVLTRCRFAAFGRLAHAPLTPTRYTRVSVRHHFLKTLARLNLRSDATAR